jgi:hypothetical protein
MTKKVKYLYKQVERLSKLVRSRKPLVAKDNRESGMSMTWEYAMRNYVLRYNSEFLSRLAYWEITHCVLHELGHIKKKATGEIQSEYRAEKFAIKVIKEYYPSYYKAALNLMKRYVKHKRPIYREAFAKILCEEGEWKRI